MRIKFTRSALFLSTIFLYSTALFAIDDIGPYVVKESSQTILDYWTPERMLNAKPMPLPRVDFNSINESKLTNPLANEPSVSKDSFPPTVQIKPDMKPLYKVITQSLSENETYSKLDNGSSNLQFSSSQLVPISADLTFPYSAVGKLFFTIPNEGNFVCSASVIDNRVVLTAGHCVHSGANGQNGFHKNWMFIPAFRDGAAPLQRWTAVFADSTSTWKTGGGGVPNAADYGMLEMSDNVVNSTTQKIGNVTGKLGFATQKLTPNHAHLLGYPCNLDNCQKMHQITAQNGPAGGSNTVRYGSDMAGGSSGGPWVQNFGIAAGGQTGGRNPLMNKVIGVTSYGSTDRSVMAQGASNFDQRFTDLFNLVCRHRAGNCGN